MQRKRILIAVDDPAVARELEGFLEADGREIAATVRAGRAAVAAGRATQPDLAILDAHMDGAIDGIEAGLRLHDELRLPIVFASDGSDADVLRRALDASPYGMIFTPVTEERLRSVVRLALDRVEVERRLARNEDRYRLLFEGNLAGVAEETLDGRILRCNPAFAALVGYANTEELVGMRVGDLFADPEEAREHRRRLVEEGALHGDEIRLRRRDGKVIWVMDSAVMVRGRVGPAEVIRTVADITERKELEAGLQQMAHHDELTGLPNRRLLAIRANQALALARRKGWTVGLAYFDLVGFKGVNDRFGHAAGDTLLERLARRLDTVLRSADTAARMGGDEFVVLFGGLESRAAALTATRRLLRKIAEPVRIAGQVMRIEARAGVSLYPDSSTDLNGLLSAADAALTAAKAAGGSVIRLAGHVETLRI